MNLNPRFADLLVERKIKMKTFSFHPQIGNALVCLAVYTNHSMRTVTNIFIVNLAVADFFVILLCLPPTVVWDVTETWFLGEVLCKVVIYFQVSRNASRLSLFCCYRARVDYVNSIIYESACLLNGNQNQLLDITCQKSEHERENFVEAEQCVR